MRVPICVCSGRNLSQWTKKLFAVLGCTLVATGCVLGRWRRLCDCARQARRSTMARRACHVLLHEWPRSLAADRTRQPCINCSARSMLTPSGSLEKKWHETRTKPLLTEAKRRCIAASAMAVKTNSGQEPVVDAIILACPLATMSPATGKPFCGLRIVTTSMLSTLGSWSLPCKMCS